MTHRTPPTFASRLIQRVRARLERVRRGGEDGFILLESIIAITLITVIMGAVGAEYVTSLSASSGARLRITATQIASSQMEQIRALQPSDLTTGRGASAVDAERSIIRNFYPSVGDSSLEAYAATGANATGITIDTIPTKPVIGNTTFTVYRYFECLATPASAGSCVTPATQSTPAYNNIRALVVVTWPQRGCATVTTTYSSGPTCSASSSSIINDDSDLTFDLNQPLPAAPVVTPVSSLTVAGGDVVSYPLTTTTRNPGVAPLTWSVTSGSLSSFGLTMSTGGLITGTVSTSSSSTTSVATTVTVTDAFNRTASQAITWTIEPTLAVSVASQASLIGKAISPVTVTATGGSGSGYTYADPNSTLPPGLSISSSGSITGTPTGQPQTYAVSLTVTDPQACAACASTPRTATTTFNWTVNYPPLALAAPANQTATVNTALNSAKQVTMSAVGGDGNYVWSIGGQPAGLSINSSTGLISGTPTALGTSNVTVTVSDPSAGVTPASASFTWSIVNKPSFGAAPAARTNSVGASVSINTSPTCPDLPCTYTLSGAPTNIVVSSAGVITGTVGGSPNVYSGVSVTASDSAGATTTTGGFTWTVVAAPTISAAATVKVSEATQVSIPLSYTCPFGSCTISLSGSVPGLGLSATSSGSGDRSSSTSLVVATSATTSTVYVTGTVQDSAVSGSATSAIYHPTITIASADAVTGATSPITWTAYAVPTIAGIAARGVTVTAVDNTSYAYTCPNSTCVITLSNSVPGLGLSTSPSVSGDKSSATSLGVTAASGTVYITGTVQASAITTSGATMQSYSPNLLISDGSYTSATNQATWIAYAVPRITSPGTQTGTAGAVVSGVSTSPSCYDSPCTYTWTLPAGLAVNSSGVISGTISSSAATGNFSAQVTITDSDGVSASTGNFTWTIYAAPTVTGLTTQKVTIGATYNTSIGYTCPRPSCTIGLSGSVPGLGLTTTSGATGNQTGTSVTVTAASGTVYIGGTVQSSAVTSGTSKAYTPSISITDGGNFTPTATSATWTAYLAPTIAAPVTRSVSVGANDSTSYAYTCPNLTCTITLSNPVPGLGLSTTASTGNNTATSVTVGTASGTLYISGTVQSSALNSGASKTYSVGLKINDGNAYTSPTGSATWTAYPAPTATALSAHSATEGVVDNIAINYSCPTASCRLSLAGAFPGLGLSTTASKSGDQSSASSLTVTATSGTVYITGTVSSSAVTGSATSQTYTPTLTITDGGTYSNTSTASWTAYAQPTATALTAHSASVGAVDNIAIAYSCPTANCRLNLAGAFPGLGLSTTSNKSGDQSSASSLTLTATSGTVYITGTVSSSAVTTGTSRTYTPTLTITDGGSYSSSSTATWTAYSAPTLTGLANGTFTRNQIGTETLNYTCPTQNCAISISGPSWVYLGTSTSNFYKSATLTSASGSLFAGGQPGSSDNTGTVTVTLTDGLTYSSNYTATFTVTN